MLPQFKQKDGDPGVPDGFGGLCRETMAGKRTLCPGLLRRCKDAQLYFLGLISLAVKPLGVRQFVIDDFVWVKE